MRPIINALIKATEFLADDMKIVAVKFEWFMGKVTLTYANGDTKTVNSAKYAEMLAQAKIDLELAKDEEEKAQREFQREQIISPLVRDYERKIWELNTAHEAALAAKDLEIAVAYQNGISTGIKAAGHIVPQLHSAAQITSIKAENGLLLVASQRQFLNKAEELFTSASDDADLILLNS